MNNIKAGRSSCPPPPPPKGGAVVSPSVSDEEIAVHSVARVVSPHVHLAVVNIYRFANSETYFTDKALLALFRVLQRNTVEQRSDWWCDIRGCRRRYQIPVKSKAMPIGALFSFTDEYEFIRHCATIERIRMALHEKGMLVFDAFRAFNSSHTGLLTNSELYGGLDWLQIPFQPNQVYEFVKRVAFDNDGLISYNDFKRVLHEDNDDAIESSGNTNSTSFGIIPPKIIPEMSDIDQDKTSNEDTVKLTPEIIHQFKVKTKQVNSFTLVWSSQGTQSQTQMSLWAPSTESGLLQSNRARVCLGHYAQRGFVNPLSSGKKLAASYLTLEVTDYATLRLNRSRVIDTVMSKILPHPLRFKQVWHFSRGDKSLYAWKPVAPEHFVALGMVCTCTEDPPALSTIRCVPQMWTMPTKRKPIKLWDDTGAGGGRPGSAWIINELNMIAIVPGHGEPSEQFYDVNSHRFFIEGQIMQKLGLNDAD